jgi:hypothetical protein
MMNDVTDVVDISLPEIQSPPKSAIPLRIQGTKFTLSFNGKPTQVTRETTPGVMRQGVEFMPLTGYTSYLTEVISQFQNPEMQLFALQAIKSSALGLIDALPDTDPRKEDARNAVTLQIQQYALKCLPPIDTNRKRAALQLNFSPAFIATADILHVPLDSPTLDASGTTQLLVDLRKKSRITTTDILGYLIQGLGAEALHDTHHVVEFIGGAAGFVKDAQLTESLEILTRNIASNERDFDTLFVNPGTDAGITPTIVAIAREYGIPTATVLALQSTLIPGYIPLVPTGQPGWEKGLYAATPCDVAIGIFGHFGDEKSALVREGIAAAMQTHIIHGLKDDLKAEGKNSIAIREAVEKARRHEDANHVDRTAIVINGGTRTIGELQEFIDGFGKIPDSRVIITRDSGRVSGYLATILENCKTIVDQRGLLAYMQTHGMLGHSIEEATAIQREVAELTDAGIFDLARDLADLSKSKWGRVHIVNMMDAEMKAYHTLPTVIYHWGQGPQAL